MDLGHVGIVVRALSISGERFAALAEVYIVMTRGPALTYTICGRTYPALELGEHDGDPFARLPLGTGLAVEVCAWRDTDVVGLSLVDPLREAGGEMPELCCTGNISGAKAIRVLAAWSRWSAERARAWSDAGYWLWRE
jgi:hypothetical protein